MRKVVGLIALVAVGVGCDEVKSNDVDTSGIYADITVTGNSGGSALASAVLRVGDATSTAFVELESGDSLTATDGANTLDMADSEILEFHSYNALFDTTTPGATYTVALARAGKDPAPTSTAVLPDAFEFVSPPSTMTGDQDVTLTWNPSGSNDAMTLSFIGDCINPDVESLPGDTGTFTLTAGTLKQSATDEDDPGCQVTVTLSRVKDGSLDAAYGGGAIRGQQVRAFNVAFTQTAS
jgi:hypothetical protein